MTSSNLSHRQNFFLGDVTFESTIRAQSFPSELRVYGVNRSEGLTPDAKYVSKNLGRYKVLKPNMFAYNPMRLNIGSIAYSTKDHPVGLVSPDYVVFGCQPEKLDPTFMNYFIKGPKWRQWTHAAGVGSVRVRIYYSELARMPVTIPPFSEQKVISHILGILDDKIKLNRRMNETLEAIARTIFKSWFVDFDPVRAKVEGRQPFGMDGETAALFADIFEETNFGIIPKGWGVKRLDEIAEVGIGKTPPRNEHQWFSEDPKDIPWISIRDLGETGTFISQTSEFLTAQSVDKFHIRRIPSNSVVLSFKLTVGRVAITDGEMLSNEAIAHFRIHTNAVISEIYLFCYLKCFRYDQLGSTSSIATAINSKIVRGINILCPPKSLVEAFEQAVRPIFAEIKCLQRESLTLSLLRDTLLPKLLSGELSVFHSQITT